MRYKSLFTVVGLVSVAAVVLFLSPVYAQQTSGNSSAVASSTVAQTDTVVNPHGSAIQAPVVNVMWRGGRFHGARFHGAKFHGARFHGARFHRNFFVKPFVFYPSTYRYYSYYPYSNCWWNGFRWVCPKRLYIY